MQQKKELSILIPTYNDVCTDSVNTLMQQAESIGDLRFEIIVADDASTDENVVEANRAIDRMTNCRYIRRENNVGRAAIRNFLAQEARYEWLLFVDSGMGIVRSDFIFNYLQAEGNPIYGGYVVEGDAENRTESYVGTTTETTRTRFPHVELPGESFPVPATPP